MTCRLFGFEGTKDHVKNVEKCLQDAQAVCEAIEDLSHTQESAVLRCLGVNDSESTDESDSEVSLEASQSFQLADAKQFKSITIKSHFNWFEIMDKLVQDGDRVNEHHVPESCFAAVMQLDLSAKRSCLASHMKHFVIAC